MTRVLRMLYDEFPNTVLLTFPEQGLGLGGVIHRVWIEEAARRNASGGSMIVPNGPIAIRISVTSSAMPGRLILREP